MKNWIRNANMRRLAPLGLVLLAVLLILPMSTRAADGDIYVPFQTAQIDEVHLIIVNQVDGGTLTPSRKTACIGNPVLLTAVSDIDTQPAMPAVVDEEGNDIEVTDEGEGVYSFIMPDCAVEVTGSFPLIPMSFSDVKSSDWFYNPVLWVARHQVMDGTNGKFEPRKLVDRAMLTQLLYELDGANPVESKSSFEDVLTGSPYEDCVNWAMETRVVRGGFPTFDIAGNLRREQVALMLFNYARYKGYDLSRQPLALTDFTDCDDVEYWAVPGVEWAIYKGIFTADGDGMLNPKATVTRAELAAMLQCFCQTVVS